MSKVMNGPNTMHVCESTCAPRTSSSASSAYIYSIVILTALQLSEDGFI